MVVTDFSRVHSQLAHLGVWRSKSMLCRPTLDNRHFGLVHTTVSCTWPELVMLVDTCDVSRHLAVTTHRWMHTRHIIL